MASTLSQNFKTGDGRILTVADIAELYRSCVSCLVPFQGSIRKFKDGEYIVSYTSKGIDCDLAETKRISKSCFVNSKQPGTIDSVSNLSDGRKVTDLAYVLSDNGNFSASITNGNSSKDGSERQLLEIWSSSQHLRTIIIPEISAHGSICLDDQFHSLAWNRLHPQNKLLYSCEHKRVKKQSFFSKPEKPDSPVGQGFNHVQDWGEGLIGIDHTILAILDVANNFDIKTIELEGYSLADAHWLDSDTKLVSVAYKEEPFRLGLSFCNNRRSDILIHDASSGQLLDKLSSDSLSYHSPRVNHKGDAFFYLSNAVYGPHCRANRLHLYQLSTRTSIELLAGQEFYIYGEMPANCFSNDDQNILFVAREQLTCGLYRLNIPSQSVSKLKFPTNAVSICDFRDDLVLASGSDTNLMPMMFIGAFNEHIAWHCLDSFVCLDDISCESHVFPTQDNTDNISAMLVTPNVNKLQHGSTHNVKSMIGDSNDLPTVVMVHGGPHSNYVRMHFAPLVFHARLGLKSLLINYRGSTGISEKYSENLCGKIGNLDVGDCMHAIRHFVHKGLINSERLIILGGSHGGFLGAHLCCQEEFKFTSAVLRNPVIDLSSMRSTTDIPDWIYATGLKHESYDHAWNLKSEDLVKIFECSPMFNVEKANVPTLMQLGTLDRRVPMSQGLRWVDALKAKGVETKCSVYPDGHALGKPEVNLDSVLNGAIWILSHLQNDNQD